METSSDGIQIVEFECPCGCGHEMQLTVPYHIEYVLELNTGDDYDLAIEEY